MQKELEVRLERLVRFRAACEPADMRVQELERELEEAHQALAQLEAVEKAEEAAVTALEAFLKAREQFPALDEAEGSVTGPKDEEKPANGDIECPEGVSETGAVVYRTLMAGAKTAKEASEASGLRFPVVRGAFGDLARRGFISKDGEGRWAVAQ